MDSGSIYSSVLNERWYYRIQIDDHTFTNGRLRTALGMVRKVLSHIELANCNCLDIGTQEGLVPILMFRQNADEITAYDRLDLTSRVNYLKGIYDVDFQYQSGKSLEEFKWDCEERFDVVNFSGILYHMMDPLAGLIIARSFVREDGLFIIETSILNTDDFALYFNHQGRYYEGSNYFQIGLRLLQYWLDMVGLLPIDCLFVQNEVTDIGRVCVVCRALEAPRKMQGDPWLSKAFVKRDMEDLGLDFARLTSDGGKIPYKIIDPDNLRCIESTRAVDLYLTYNSMRPFQNEAKWGQLFLDDQY